MRLSADKVQIKNIVDEVVMLTSCAVDKAGRPIKKPEVELVSTIADDLPVIEADAHRCTQMLYNLITNALKFTEHGSVTISATADDEREFLTIAVADTGIGIATHNTELIFRPFEQEDQSESRNYEGLGLGLSISREVAVKHGGSLSVDSELGRGSTFVVSLPYKLHKVQHGDTDGADGEGKGESSADEGGVRGRAPQSNHAQDSDVETPQKTIGELPPTVHGRVLVLEESANQQELLAALSALEVVTCPSTHECCEYLKRGKATPDVVVVDGTPHGLATLSALRLRYSLLELPVIVMAMDSDPGSMREAIAKGCSDWITAPFKEAEVVPRIKLQTTIKKLHADTMRQMQPHSRAAAVQQSAAAVRSQNSVVTQFKPQTTSNAPSVEKAQELQRQLADQQQQHQQVHNELEQQQQILSRQQEQQNQREETLEKRHQQQLAEKERLAHVQQELHDLQKQMQAQRKGEQKIFDTAEKLTPMLPPGAAKRLVDGEKVVVNHSESAGAMCASLIGWEELLGALGVYRAAACLHEMLSKLGAIVAEEHGLSVQILGSGGCIIVDGLRQKRGAVDWGRLLRLALSLIHI